MTHIGWRFALWRRGTWRKRFTRCLQCGCPNPRGTYLVIGYRHIYPVCGHHMDDDYATLQLAYWNANRKSLDSKAEKKNTLHQRRGKFMTLTVRQQLLIILGRAPKSMTCVQLVAVLNKTFSTHRSSATISSALKKMHDEQLVARIDNAGKRGGYAYKLSRGGMGWYIGLVAKLTFTNFSEAVRSIVEQ